MKRRPEVRVIITHKPSTEALANAYEAAIKMEERREVSGALQAGA